jgi:hypothetical protein
MWTDVSEMPTARAIDLMEAVHTPETSVYFNDATQCYVPEGCNVPVLYFFTHKTV